MDSNEKEFFASKTFPASDKKPDDIPEWQFEQSEPHGNTILHWFSSFTNDASQLIGVAVSDQNNHWLGSAWSNLKDAYDKKCVVRDGASAEVLKESLLDIQDEFVRKHRSVFGAIGIFFAFTFGGSEKNIDLVRTMCLCELRNTAVLFSDTNCPAGA